MLQPPAHDDVQHVLVVLLGDLVDNRVLAGRVRSADDGLCACPGSSQGAVGADVDILIAAIRDEVIVAPDWVHLDLNAELLFRNCDVNKDSTGRGTGLLMEGARHSCSINSHCRGGVQVL